MKHLYIIVTALALSLLVLAAVVLSIVSFSSFSIANPNHVHAIAALSSSCFAGLAFFGVVFSVVSQTTEAAKARKVQRLSVLTAFVHTLPLRITHLEKNGKSEETQPLRDALDLVFAELLTEYEASFHRDLIGR